MTSDEGAAWPVGRRSNRMTETSDGDLSIIKI